MWSKRAFRVYAILYIVCLALTVAFLMTWRVHAAAFFHLLMWIFSILSFVAYSYESIDYFE